MAGMSPTQLTLRNFRDEGFLCQVVEKWNPHARIRQDLFGFIDVLCVSHSKTVAVQSTSYSNMSARVKKIKAHENLQAVLEAGWVVVVQGWHKKNGKWVAREEIINEEG